MESHKCLIKPSVPIGLSDSGSGCAGIDVAVQGEPIQIESISFRNFYTAAVTIKVRRRENPLDVSVYSPYKTLIKNFVLMPKPHFEQGGQNIFRISSKQMLFCPTDVTDLRIILRQPSHCWANFGLNEIKINMPGPTEEFHDERKDDADAVMPVRKAQSELGDLSVMLKHLTTTDKLVIGRFDVYGTYDLNLLSYT
eukprot:m.102327 g.102327  ORF g.102327 m.102327 type:complete len:196 (+) comp37166_c0_seq2:74-661(+)